MTFLFYTADGYTQDLELNDTENCQIIGISNGSTLSQAYSNLIEENSYILTNKYKNIMALELKSDKIFYIK